MAPAQVLKRPGPPFLLLPPGYSASGEGTRTASNKDLHLFFLEAVLQVRPTEFFISILFSGEVQHALTLKIKLNISIPCEGNREYGETDSKGELF